MLIVAEYVYILQEGIGKLWTSPGKVMNDLRSDPRRLGEIPY